MLNFGLLKTAIAVYAFVAEFGLLKGFQFNLYSEWIDKSIRIFSPTTFYFIIYAWLLVL